MEDSVVDGPEVLANVMEVSSGEVTLLEESFEDGPELVWTIVELSSVELTPVGVVPVPKEDIMVVVVFFVVSDSSEPLGSVMKLSPNEMRFMLLFSRQGKLRLQKWYLATPDKDKKKMVRELMQVVLARKPKMYASLYFCCAIEGQDNELITLELIHRYVELLDKYFGSLHPMAMGTPQLHPMALGTPQLHPMSMGLDWMILEVFSHPNNVRILYVGQVCELDIIFNFEKAYFILDEFVMGGEIQDTSKKSVLKAIEQADLLQEVRNPL
ncbi:hypothetical protein Q9233_015295 [Columba guinea]|nr:hypothetical protein Q9233_015295 [Columba guinea]